jgi:hypothetical protein
MKACCPETCSVLEKDDDYCLDDAWGSEEDEERYTCEVYATSDYCWDDTFGATL